jgi:hypothetical protein
MTKYLVLHEGPFYLFGLRSVEPQLHMHMLFGHALGPLIRRLLGAPIRVTPYKASWRHVGQHARCTTCGKLGEMRLLATTREAKEHVSHLYDQHVTSVFKDSSREWATS